MSDRLALIIANSTFADPALSRLKTPGRDAKAFSDVLKDPAIGNFDVTLLLDQPSGTVRQEVARLYRNRSRSDLLLLYFSGHGIRDEHGDLYLATSDTQMDLVSATALEAAFVRRQINKSGSQRNIIMLDCCHSGAFGESKGILGESVGTEEAFAGNGYGRVILTASDAIELAWERGKWIRQNGMSMEGYLSVFTQFLVEGLRTGAADLDKNGEITLDELYDYVYGCMRSSGDNRQTPCKWAIKVRGQLVIAYNPHASTKSTVLDRYLADLNKELSIWRGLGLSRDIRLQCTYVSATVKGGSASNEMSEAELLQSLLKAKEKPSHLLVEGDAGRGKSTLLRHWSLKLIEERKEGRSDYLPIFLPLGPLALRFRSGGNWNPPLSELVADRYSSSGSQRWKALRETISETIEQGHALILLDGVDEITEQDRPRMKDWIYGIQRTMGQNPIVVTSRPIHFTDSFSGFLKHTICIFDLDQQQLFIENWFGAVGQPERADSMKEYLSSPKMFLVKDIAGNPLYLTMICIEYELTNKISRTPGTLMDQFTKILLEDWDLERAVPRIQTGNLDLKRQVLESVAAQFFVSGQMTFSLHELVKLTRDVIARMPGTVVDAEKLLREIEATSGLLIENRHGEWQFSHLLFQEFFTARFYWRQKHEEQNQTNWLQDAMYDERYDNVIEFYSQLGGYGT